MRVTDKPARCQAARHKICTKATFLVRRTQTVIPPASEGGSTQRSVRRRNVRRASVSTTTSWQRAAASMTNRKSVARIPWTGILRTGILFAAVLLVSSSFAAAADQVSAAPAGATVAAAPPTQPEFNAADNAWVLVSSALVLFMTAPALALFYSGLVRRKNVLSVMMQCVFLMCVMTLVWAIYGYSLVFGGSNPWIGDGSFLCMNGVNAVWTDSGPHLPMATGLTIPVMTHMLFQGMFFIITPALICGAFAERMRFSTMVVFSILWGTVHLLPAGPLGLGQGLPLLRRVARHPRRRDRLRRRDRDPRQFRRLGPGLRPGPGQAIGLRQGRDAAPQPDLHRARRRDALGRLVRVQRRQRPGGRPVASCAFAATHFAAAAGGHHLGLARMEVPRQAEHAGGLLRPSRRAGLHYPSRRLRHAHARVAVRRHRRDGLLLRLHQAQGPLPLRRFAGCLRRPRRRRHARRRADRLLRHPGHRCDRRRQAPRPARRRAALGGPGPNRGRWPGRWPSWGPT